MPYFSQDDLKHLKKLCRIDCSPDEEEEILSLVGRVLEYVQMLEEADVAGVEPCDSVLQGLLKNLMRDDQPGLLLSREAFLANAPDQIGGMVRVPPVLKVQ
jgi:aspartyl-tRNA(Asn)/glutamyl-tRNA(Gln) amidotransferase subunit C